MKLLLLLALIGQLDKSRNERSDFYPVKLTVANHAEMERDFSVSWEKRWPVEVIDEDSRYEAHLVEELEERRLHLNRIFQIRFVENGDVSSFTLNRISYKIPDHLFETPISYVFLEHIESDLFHEFDLETWRIKKQQLHDAWETMEFLRRGEFLMDKDIIDFDYEYYEYDFGYFPYDEQVYIEGKYVTYESLGYVPLPKPKMPPKPKKRKNPFKFKLE